ncbi:MAG: hypothetical protein R2762_11990 [Bryobacteraceae bacterium]
MQLLGAHEDALLEMHAPDGHEESVGRTFLAAVEGCGHGSRWRVELLSVFAFLAPDDISMPCFDACRRDFEGLGTALGDPLERARLLAALRGLSLLEAVDGGWSVHLLVQSVMRRLRGAGDESSGGRGGAG